MGVIGGFLVLVLPLIVTRGITFAPGWIEYSADFSSNMNRSVELQQWSSGWNGFLGEDNSATLSFSPLFALPLQVLGTAGTQRLLLFLTYALIVGSSFFALWWWFRDLGLAKVAHVLSPIGATLYLINPWVASESVHLLYLWLYALLPLTFHCVRRSVASPSRLNAVGWAWLAGISTIATMTAYGIAFHGILALVVVVASAPRSLTRSMLVWVVYSACAIALSSYWLLPELVGFKRDFEAGTSWALFTTKDMYILSPTSALPFAIRGVYRDWTAALARQVVGDGLVTLAFVIAFTLPITAASAMVALGKRANATVTALVVTGTIALVMANGTAPPVGDLYAKLASAPLVSQVAFVLFKGPYKWVPVAVFVMLFLALATVGALLKSSRRAVRFLGSSALLGLIVWSALLGSPLLTGNLAAYMEPVDPPKSLVSSLAAISTLTDSAQTKAVWLPFSTSGDPLNPPWAPSRSSLPLIDGGVPPVASWEAPTPISSRGVSWLAPASGRMRDQIIQRALQNDPKAQLGSLMTALGCRFVVVRVDVASGPSLASRLMEHTDLRLVFRDQYFDVFESLIAPETVQVFQPTVLVAGLDALAAGSSIAGPSAAQRPYVVATDIPSGTEDLFLSNTPEVWFGPGKDWADLALDAWDRNGRFVDASALVVETVPLSHWDKDTWDSHLWVPARLGGLDGSLFEPSKASAFLVANGPAELSLPLESVDAGSEIWARVFVSPLSQSVTAGLPDGEMFTALTSADTTMGWQWKRLVRLPLNVSRVSISVTGQLSAIDQFAIVPTGSVAAAVSSIKQITSSANIVTGGWWQGFDQPPSNDTASKRTVSTRTIATSGQGRYVIAVQPTTAAPIDTVWMNGIAYKLRSGTNGWLLAPNIDLPDGPVSIGFQTDQISRVLLVRNANGGVDAAVAPDESGLISQSPAEFQELNYFENFDPGWVPTGQSPSVVHYRANGFINGYVGSWPANGGVAYEFSPDGWIQRGRIASLLVLAISALTYAYFLSRTKRFRSIVRMSPKRR